MAQEIEYKDVLEIEPHRFVAEAREIGLHVGEWPETLPTKIGNGMPFLRRSKKVQGCDLLWVTYKQSNGCLTLRVFND